MKAMRVIGIGNSLAADDGAGPAVVEELLRHPIPDSVEVISAGADGLAAIQYMEDDGDVIIVDAVCMGARPGTVLTFPAKTAKVRIRADVLSLHGIGLSYALELADKMRMPARVTIVGIEPETVDPCREMSEAVRRAVNEAVDVVLRLVRERSGVAARPAGLPRRRGATDGEEGADH